ncbi:uncharacterized protein LOC110670745 [Hevea brasiliensis]|uniref:uncharacterized protein LOC110670745 n=1 Tax=Hevea brasiliensis TaxID=3981 RepID=UPI0025F34D3C|nr:uncharacterized protein LOC110670745 [Hevea brasiliensis]
MTNQLQKQYEKMQTSPAILHHLQELFGKNSRMARYEISKQLFRKKIHEEQDVGEHVLDMIRLIEQLEALDFTIDFSLPTDLILQSLPEFFGSFITNFHMTKQECTLAGLLNILVIAQGNMFGRKGKEVALFAYSSSCKTKKKKKRNKKKPSSTLGPFDRVGKKSQTMNKKEKAAPANKGKYSGIACHANSTWVIDTGSNSHIISDV